MERRLAAILAADVVGFSRLVGQDEEGTLQNLASCRVVIDDLVAKHHGRVFNSAGDSVVAEFASPVEAVRSAVAIQHELEIQAAKLPADRRMQFRIGINLGDVVVEGDNLLGDGVNVAARLESLAETGGICISQSVFDQVRQKLDLGYEFLGNNSVKNIAEPIPVYRVLSEPEFAGKIISNTNVVTRNWRPLAIAAGVALFIGSVVLVSWLKPWEPEVAVASVERMALPLPDKPSIVVLPFINMSGDSAQDIFTDGMTDDLITDLSKVSDLFVIAGNTSFSFKGKPVEISRVAEKLGVRYVLEGSIRRSGDRVRVNAKLIDATTGGSVWAERYEGNSSDYFTVQDSFVRKIVAALSLNLSRDEREEIASGQTANLKAREAFQAGWELYRQFTAESNARAAEHFKSATQIDSNYGRAFAALSMTYVRSMVGGWYQELDLNGIPKYLGGETYAIALQYLKESEKNSSSLTKVAASQISLFRNLNERALTEASKAIALDPNDPEAQIAMGLAMITTGKSKAGLEFVRTAMRLNPNYPTHYSVALALGFFSLNDMPQTVVVLESALEKNPGAVDLLPLLAASYSHLGRRKDARSAYLKWKPLDNEDALKFFDYPYNFQFKFAENQREVRDRINDGVFLASLPERISVASLRDQLRTGDTSQRVEAIQTLERFGAQAVEAVPDLVAAIDDEYGTVRTNAIIALGKIGPIAKAAVPALVAIQDKSTTKFIVKRELKRIQGN